MTGRLYMAGWIPAEVSSLVANPGKQCTCRYHDDVADGEPVSVDALAVVARRRELRHTGLLVVVWLHTLHLFWVFSLE